MSMSHRGKAVRRLGLFAVCAAAVNLSCRTSNSAVEDTAVVVAVSVDEAATQAAQTIIDPASTDAINELGALSFAAYYDRIFARAAGPVVTIGQDTYRDDMTALNSAKDTYLARYSAYPTLHDYWVEAGIDFTTITPDNIKEALRMAATAGSSSGWFDPATYQNGSGLDTDAKVASIGGSSGLNLDGFKGPNNFFDCINRLNALRQRVHGPLSAGCELFCAATWATINDCDQLITVASELLERFKPNDQKARGMARAARRLVSVAPRVQRLIQIAPQVGDAMQRQHGGRWSDHPDLPRAGGPAVDNTPRPAEDAAGKR